MGGPVFPSENGVANSSYIIVRPNSIDNGDSTIAGSIAWSIAQLPSTGGTVYLMEGTYGFDQEMLLNGLSNIMIQCSSWATVLKINDNISAINLGDMHNMIKFTNCDHCRITGGTLDGNYQNQNLATLAMCFGSTLAGGPSDYREPMDIQYIGAGSACSATISGNTLTTSVTGGPGSEDLNLDLTAAAYDTLSELVAHIDGLSAYSANIVHTGFNNQLTKHLFATTYADIRTGSTDMDFNNVSTANTYEIFGDNVIIVDSDHITVEGCNIINAPHMGVLLSSGATECQIINNYGTYCNWRIVELWTKAGNDTFGNIISGNIFNESFHSAIVTEFSSVYSNIISNNSVYKSDISFDDGDFMGIQCFSSNHNTLANNTLVGCGIMLDGASLSSFNVITGNVTEGLDASASAYETRGLHVKNGKFNVIIGNTFNDPFWDTVRFAAAADNNIFTNNILSNNDNGSRFPILLASGASDNIIKDNVLTGNTNGISDAGTRTAINGIGLNGSNDPASAGDWNTTPHDAILVKWDNGAGKDRLSQYIDNSWIPVYVEP